MSLLSLSKSNKNLTMGVGYKRVILNMFFLRNQIGVVCKYICADLPAPFSCNLPLTAHLQSTADLPTLLFLWLSLSCGWGVRESKGHNYGLNFAFSKKQLTYFPGHSYLRHPNISFCQFCLSKSSLFNRLLPHLPLWSKFFNKWY